MDAETRSKFVAIARGAAERIAAVECSQKDLDEGVGIVIDEVAEFRSPDLEANADHP